MRLVAHRHPAESEGVGRRKTSHEQLRALTLIERTMSGRGSNVARDPEEKSILAHPQFRWRSRNSRILRLASVAAFSLYSNQRPSGIPLSLRAWVAAKRAMNSLLRLAG
jgi:hypothetical protein